MRQTVNLSQTSDLSNVPETKQKSFYEYLNLPEPSAMFEYPDSLANLSQVAIEVPKPVEEEDEEEETKNEYAELLEHTKEQIMKFRQRVEVGMDRKHLNQKFVSDRKAEIKVLMN